MNQEPYEFTNADKAHADRKLVGTMDQFKPGDLLLCRDGGKAVYVEHVRGGANAVHRVVRADGLLDVQVSGLALETDDGSRDILGPWSSRFPALVWDGNRADTPFGEYKVYQDETFDWCWIFGGNNDCGGFQSAEEAKEHAGRDWADRLALAVGEVL